MKKIIVSILIISSYCFSQTGILTEKGRSAMGLWGGFGRTIDCSDCDVAYSLNFDYMANFGLEVGVGAGKVGETDTKRVKLLYHLKGANSSNNVAFGLAKSRASQSGISLDANTLAIAFYNDTGFLFEIDKIDIPDLGLDDEVLTFGNYWKGQTVSWGIAYSASWDLFDAMIEDGDLEYLKYGTLTVSIGGVF